MTNRYHCPPEMVLLLVDTIPVLCKSKQDVILFFADAGIGDQILGDLKQQLRENKEALTKYALVRTVLERLNEEDNVDCAPVQAVLKRVVEWRDFSVCYADVRCKAEDGVQRIRNLVERKDAETRKRLAEENEWSQRNVDFLLNQQRVLERRRAFMEIRTAMVNLCDDTNRQRRGKMLEEVINRYCKMSDIHVRDAFTLCGLHGEGVLEQIDGVVEIDGSYYLVEMKWLHVPVGIAEISQHMNRLYSRSNVHSIFVSASGYTGPAIECCRGALQQKLIVLCELREIMVLLEQEKLLKEFLKAKIQAALLEKNPLYYPLRVGVV